MGDIKHLVNPLFQSCEKKLFTGYIKLTRVFCQVCDRDHFRVSTKHAKIINLLPHVSHWRQPTVLRGSNHGSCIHLIEKISYRQTNLSDVVQIISWLYGLIRYNINDLTILMFGRFSPFQPEVLLNLLNSLLSSRCCLRQCLALVENSHLQYHLKREERSKKGAVFKENTVQVTYIVIIEINLSTLFTWLECTYVSLFSHSLLVLLLVLLHQVALIP